MSEEVNQIVKEYLKSTGKAEKPTVPKDGCLSNHNTKVVEKLSKEIDTTSSIVSTSFFKALMAKKNDPRDRFETLEMMKSLEAQKKVKKQKVTRVLEDISTDSVDIDLNDEILEVYDTIKDNPDPKEVEDEIVKSQLINYLHGKPLDTYNSAQKINVSSKITRWGKVATNEDSNTYLGRTLSRQKITHFGSIGDFTVDSLPIAMIRRYKGGGKETKNLHKGTQITWMSTKNSQSNGVQLISRRFISRLINYWAYVVDLGGNTKKSNYMLALDLWSVSLTHPKTNRTYKMIDGYVAIDIIRDILFLIRNKQVDPSKMSQHLYNIIRDKTYHSKKPFEEILGDMKKRVYYTRQLGEIAWSYSDIHPNYLRNLLMDLRSGDYDLEIKVPSIINLYKYPIECKDTQVKQMTEKQHEKNLDDYDISQYIYERE